MGLRSRFRFPKQGFSTMPFLSGLLPNLFSRLLTGGLAIALAISCAMLWAEQRHSAKWEKRAGEWQAAHDKLEANIRAKTAEAKAADATKVIRVERDQSSVNQETDRDYQKQLADLRRRADALRVRAGTAALHPGGGGGAPVLVVPGAAGSSDGAAAQEGLPPEDALTASEQALQLEALQNWVRGQAAVER